MSLATTWPQYFLGRRRPWLEGHALEELEDAECVHAVSLAALEDGGGEVFDGFGVYDHDLDPRCCMQCERKGQGVDAGGFEADACGSTVPGGPVDQLAVTGCVVAEGSWGCLSVATQAADEGS